ncbi:acyltransferase domain-containing protein [Streptomyces sp. NPDC048606]|uniref:ACP S-malonyltransferase n=1 Tax=Streptomyces sp. NPDC048606 TaxID=3154726 RepID=UPI0034314CE0
MTRVFMFPGQGSQRPGMGAALFDRFPERVAEADEVLGHPVRALCEDPARLERTEFTQPAVYVVNALAYEAAREDAPAPDVAIGHSLGEYNALHAAGVFGFADGLRLVLGRARAMAGVTGGGMAAVIGLDEAVIRLLLRRAGLVDVEVANWNTADQTIVAGPLAALEEAAALLREAGARTVRRLKVSGPFHTRHMTPAAEAFAPLLEAAALEAPRFPVVANHTARPYGDTGPPAAVLTRQIDHPVRWRETVEGLLEADPDTEFKEIGDSQVLTRMLRALRAEGAEA